MSQRDGFEHGVPSWVGVMQPEPEQAAAFYGALFGWETIPQDVYVLARRNGRDVAAVTPLPPMMEDPPPAGWVTHVEVGDAVAAAERARAAGGEVILDGMDSPMGRISVLLDPAGATLVAKEPDRHAGAQVVNEPGAWAMSRLDTPDPDRAAAFYGAVFGWTTEAFDLGDAGAVTLFRLPGYVGGEPEQSVSRETVAVMAQAPEGTRARWTPDFWVDDVDATVATAVERGGRAVAEAADSPVGRTAMLADPAGAEFSVSRVVA
jgi:predicted enzyme related to lactoylglutathione lyase